MSKFKNSIFLFVITIINFVLGICLCVFTFPQYIPTFVDANEKIVSLGSKWLILISAILPIIIYIIFLCIKKKEISTLLKSILGLLFYQNMIQYIYLSFSNNLNFGELVEIPITAYIFLPISFLIMIYGFKLKHCPFNSFWGINLKSAKETQFLWTQTHIFSSHFVSRMGLLLTIISIIFSFFHLWFIPLIIIIISTILSLSIIANHSNSIYLKYLDMKNRKDKLDEKKKQN